MLEIVAEMFGKACCCHAAKQLSSMHRVSSTTALLQSGSERQQKRTTLARKEIRLGGLVRLSPECHEGIDGIQLILELLQTGWKEPLSPFYGLSPAAPEHKAITKKACAPPRCFSKARRNSANSISPVLGPHLGTDFVVVVLCNSAHSLSKAKNWLLAVIAAGYG